MLLWFDAFELGSVAAVSARYESGGISAIASADGRTNQYADLGGGNIIKSFAATAGLVLGICRKLDGNERDLITLRDSGNAANLTLRESGGTLQLWRGAGGTGVLLNTSDPITSGFWVYIEVRAVIDNAAGEYELKVNEVSMFADTGVDTQATGNTDVASVMINGQLTNGGGVTCLIDDYYIANLDAPMPLGDFYGNLKIEHRGPSGAGSNTGLTPSAGANYTCVDDNPQNGDTDYVYSSNVGDKDTYALQDMAAVSGSVRGVQLTAVARKDDALVRSIATVVRSGGTDYDGDTQALTTSYAHYYQRYDQDPDTSAEWDIAGVNALEIGAKVAA